MSHFWNTTSIIGLSPMDGVTDAAFRKIVDLHGKPQLLVTEFIPVEGITRGAVQILKSFIHHKTDTPTLGQIYGTDLDAYRQATLIVCELGFDGVDINMGCPDRSISGRGAGAGLIRTPELARDIIATVKQAVHDWSEGLTLEDVGLRPSIIDHVRAIANRCDIDTSSRIGIPVSVKTRTGYDQIQTQEWISHIIEARPAAITLHGRTLAQMYTGLASWDEIGKAAELARDAGIPFLGNGDIKSRAEALDKIKQYGLSGVLIGRAAFGNPWIFQGTEPTAYERLQTALQHAQMFEELLPDGHFLSIRKHLAWYTKGFDQAAETRARLMSVNNSSEIKEILEPFLKQFAE
ncbi:tRNA-dihydrouridine synthase [Candidatus Woesebacteria bacterium]|nr:tRNA-dihydrouridine synthase [Candidatus Woesebacteria bacterium]